MAPGDDAAPSCIVAKVSLPLRWEHLPVEEPAIDERLWFDAPCGGRDFLTGNGHTFIGRMAAWCPFKRLGHNVSLNEMGTMSEQARYFVAGFLEGAKPGTRATPTATLTRQTGLLGAPPPTGSAAPDRGTAGGARAGCAGASYCPTRPRHASPPVGAVVQYLNVCTIVRRLPDISARLSAAARACPAPAVMS